MTGDEQLNNVSAEPVGQQLRRAREKAGLSLAAVADQQHLRVSVIQAIESGDYSKIDTELFLKGYVRAYARQVGLDADSIIRDLDTELEPRRQEREQALQANPLVNIERRRRQKRRAAKLILVLVAAALIGFLAFTYLSNKYSALPATPQPEAEQPEAVEDPAGFQPDSTATAPLIEADEPAVVVPEPQEPGDEPVSEARSEEHTSELHSRPHLVCRLLLEKKKKHRIPLPQLLERELHLLHTCHFGKRTLHTCRTLF